MFISRKRIEELEWKVKVLERHVEDLEEKTTRLDNELEVLRFINNHGKDHVEISATFENYTSFVEYIYVYDGEIKTVKYPMTYYSLPAYEIVEVDSKMAIIKEKDIYYKLDKKQCVVVELPRYEEKEEEVTAE